MRRPLDGWLLARVAVALASLVPFVSGLARGASFYFRDLSSYFFPLRAFVAEGLRQGELRQWNPYVNEGTPVLLPPIGYPVDALQALLPGEWGVSLLLALHVPIAALTFLSLGRRLGLGACAAATGALAYALSGFTLSSLNLYIHLEAIAWAPLAIALVHGAARGTLRDVALAAAAVALCVSTTGVEIAAQAIFCAFVLVASRRPPELARFASAVALGLGVAAAPLVGLATQVTGSQRESGFRIAESLAHSVHPGALVQTVVAGLFGDPIAAGTDYWGGRLSNGQFPYVLSLYLGVATLALAACGALYADGRSRRLLLVLAAGLLVACGRYARLDVLLELVPALAKFRFPVKAFYLVTLAVALLAGLGAQRLLESRGHFRSLALVAGGLGLGVLALAGACAWLPAVNGWLQQSLFRDSFPLELRAQALRRVAADAASGAMAAIALATVAWLAARQRVGASFALAAAAAIVAADLVRAGAGLNPMASGLYALSPEMTQVAGRLRSAGGRVFTCLVQAMPSFREAARRVGHTSVWSTAVWQESLSPYANVAAGIETAGADATALAAARATLTTAEVVCQDKGTLARLRQSGVRFVLSVQPFANDALRLVDVASPARIAPLSIYVYELARSLPDPSVASAPDDVDASGATSAIAGAGARYLESPAGVVRVAVETPREGWLVLRRTGAAGWSARVNGAPAALEPANGRHQAVRVPAGASEVVLRYAPPRAAAGLAISLASLAAVGALYAAGGVRSAAPAGAA